MEYTSDSEKTCESIGGRLRWIIREKVKRRIAFRVGSIGEHWWQRESAYVLYANKTESQ